MLKFLCNLRAGITFSCPSWSPLLLKEFKIILPWILIWVVLQGLGKERRKKCVCFSHRVLPSSPSLAIFNHNFQSQSPERLWKYTVASPPQTIKLEYMERDAAFGTFQKMIWGIHWAARIENHSLEPTQSNKHCLIFTDFKIESLPVLSLWA